MRNKTENRPDSENMIDNKNETENRSNSENITELGNPAKPQGEAGTEMLMRMAESHSEVTEWGLGFGNLCDDIRILDVGCGSGMAIKRISHRLPGAMLYGVDYSKVSVELASRNNTDGITDKKVTIKEASVEELPFDDDSFDLAYSVESFYFWPDPVKGLREIKRTLKQGGCALIIADIYDCDELTQKQRDNIKKYNMNNPTLEGFEKYLTDAGYRDIKVHTKPGTTWVCACGYR